MASRLILHIGTEKTGSTAIQRFLASKREWLGLNGFAVPCSLGPAEHRRFPLLFYQSDQIDDLTNKEGLDPLSWNQRSQKMQHWLKTFEQEISQSPNQCWIVSSEHIHSRLLHRHACMDKLATYIHNHFEETHVLVYLRDPLSAALSLWSTAVLNGAALTEMPLPDNEYWQRLCCHRKTINHLQQWFPGQFQLRLFRPDQWIDGDIIRDFCEATDISLPADYQSSYERANSSLSWLSLALIARLNQNGRPSRELINDIRKTFDHLPPPTANALQKHAYDKAFASSNAWVRDHYFPSMYNLF